MARTPAEECLEKMREDERKLPEWRKALEAHIWSVVLLREGKLLCH